VGKKKETQTFVNIEIHDGDTQRVAPKAAAARSELRQDIITGDWVVIATGRAKRPDEFAVPERARENEDVSDPFFDLEASGQKEPLLAYRGPDREWSLVVIPNLYPAFTSGKVTKDLSEGPYFAMSGAGYHEVIITRDPKKSIAELPLWQVAEIVDAYQDRYLSLMTKKTVKYIQIFHNHGKEAGASITHPHSQLMAIPVISPYIDLQLKGAESYRRNHKSNVFQTILDHEREARTRCVFENEHFLVFCPFASRVAFETWIMPKRSGNPYFERITEEEKLALAEALQKALIAIRTGLGDPPYNFFLNTAPCDGREYPQYRWHFEILPKTSVWAGFELSTGIEVSTIEPEKAAEYLRERLEP
jgi:UDPglucose--hexose-1-phosphate uridylyltransferase